MHIVAFAYMAGMGLDQASATIIGYNIGKNNLVKAKLFYKQFQQATVMIAACEVAFLYFGQDYIVWIFTKDEDVQKLVKSVLYLICLNIFPDVYEGMLKGLIKSLALQK